VKVTLNRITAAGLAPFLFAWTLATHGKYSASGDEPHYLIMTQSVVADRDLDLANNYAQNDGRLFGHDGLGIELHAVRSRTGHVRSIHDVGLGVALVPVYAAAQRIAGLPPESPLKRFRMDRGLFTYSLVSLFLIGVTSLGMALLASGFSNVAHGPYAAALAIVAGISPPIVSHAFLVFPETPALFVTSVVVWFSMRPPTSRDTSTFLALVSTLGALPWAHHKFAVYVPGLVFVLVWKRWHLLRALTLPTKLVALTLLVAPQIALQIWTWQEWGTLAGALTTETVPFSAKTMQSGLVGLWVDRQAGLLAYAPLYWIVPACVWLTWRQTWIYLVPAILLYLPASAFSMGWWSGFAPAARYLTPAMPLLLVPVACAIGYRTVRIATLFLVVPQLVMNGIVWQHPRWLWPSEAGNRVLQGLGPPGRAYEMSLLDVQGTGVGVAVVWIALAAAVASTAVSAASRREADGTPVAAVPRGPQP